MRYDGLWRNDYGVVFTVVYKENGEQRVYNVTEFDEIEPRHKRAVAVLMASHPDNLYSDADDMHVVAGIGRVTGTSAGPQFWLLGDYDEA